jgi:hypothetical protein
MQLELNRGKIREVKAALCFLNDDVAGFDQRSDGVPNGQFEFVRALSRDDRFQDVVACLNHDVSLNIPELDLGNFPNKMIAS